MQMKKEKEKEEIGRKTCLKERKTRMTIKRNRFGYLNLKKNWKKSHEEYRGRKR